MCRKTRQINVHERCFINRLQYNHYKWFVHNTFVHNGEHNEGQTLVQIKKTAALKYLYATAYLDMV